MSGIFGGIGKLELAPVNAPNDPLPYYVDITTFWRAEGTPLSITRGRQTELDAIQPSQLTAVLDNTDNRFTTPINTEIMQDFYNNRTVANGWGNASVTGQAWTVSGTASNWSVGGGDGSTVSTSAQGDRFATMNLGLTNGEMDVVFGATIPASGVSRQGALMRFDGNNYYAAHAMIDVNANVTLVIRSVTGGGTIVNDLVSVPIGVITVSGNPLFVKFNCYGPVLRAKLWDLNQQTEPTSWVTVNDYQVTTGTQVGCFFRNDQASGSETFLTYASSFEQQSVLPYGLGAGMPLRYSETIGERTFTLFTGFVQFPDVDNWQPIGYQEVQLSATDLLARLGRTAPALSTLGAHIVGSVRNNALKNYWPLLDAGAPIVDAIGTSTVSTFFSTGTPAVEGQPAINYQGGPTLPGDDVATLQLVPGLDGGVPVRNPYLNITSTSTFFNVAPGQVLTFVGWFNRSSIDNFAEIPVVWDINNAVGSMNLLFNLDSGSTTSWHWRAEYFDGTTAFDVDSTQLGNAMATNRWYIIAIQWGFSPNVLNLWVDGQQYTGTFTGTPAVGNADWPKVQIAGSLAHMQYYLGAPTDFTFTDFTAQRQVGLAGLAYQTTGQRVTSILNYAGVPAGLQNVDAGESFMSIATLAGQTAGQALQTAVDTERARAFISGDGHYGFQDRQHTLNV